MTINLNQARKLAELGVKRKTLKYWGVMNAGYRGTPRIADAWTDLGIYDNVLPAYNAEELLGMLKGDLEMYRFEGECTASTAVNHDKPSQDCTTFYGATLTEALCNKLIFDLENGVVTVEEVNKWAL